MSRDWVYGFSEADIETALRANGWFISWGDEWVHESWTYTDRGGYNLKEAFEKLLRSANIK